MMVKRPSPTTTVIAATAAALTAALAVGVLTTARLAHAGGLAEAGELEAARANARAGGPVSDRDKELLARYGCLSGTRSPACGPWGRPPQAKRAPRRPTR